MDVSGDVHPVANSAVGQPIPGPLLEDHVLHLGHRNAAGFTGYDEEYLVLDQRSDTNFFGDFSEALKHCNRPKNRYSNVLPLDRTRVALRDVCGDGCAAGADYINANYVDGIHEQQYVATQGPLKETSEDFWRMLWEQESNIVVMLTRITESGKTKCHKYWPGKHKSKSFGSVTVSLVRKEKEHGLVSRIVRLHFDPSKLRVDSPSATEQSGDSTSGGAAAASGDNVRCDTDEGSSLVGGTREIVHFQYKEWPDHGRPSSATSFRHLLHLVDAFHNGRGPIVVHCSAGIGRTGTFCTVHTIVQRLEQHYQEHPEIVPTFNIFDTVLRLRANRVGMVQSKDQYEFCYKAVLEEYRARVTQLADEKRLELEEQSAEEHGK